MRKSISGPRWWLQSLVLLALVLCVVSMPKPAQATPSVGTGVTSSTAIINKIINSTPGLNKVVIGSSGVTVTAAGETAVAARGIVVPVSAEAAAAVSAGRIAGIAARAIKVGSWIGVATVVAPWIMDQAGVKVCPPPDFFCKAGPDVGVDPTSGGYYATAGDKSVVYGGTAQSVCQKLFDKMGSGQQSASKPFTATYNSYADAWGCVGPTGSWATVYYSNATCPAGSTKKGKDCVTTGPDVSASEGDVGNALEAAMMAVPSRMGTVFSALQSNNAPIWSSLDPVTVTPKAATVTAPVEIRTETVPKPDGSIDTVKTEVKTEVKPVVTGTNLGDTKIDYPTTITTTTTTTNNVTNVTTTTTNVTNIYGTPDVKTRDNPPDPGPPPPLPQTPADAAVKNGQELKIPDDYNREATQQKVLSELTKLNNPEISAKAPDGNDQVDAYKAKGLEGDTAISGITEAAIGFKAWFPSLPTAQCVNPKVPGVGDSMYEIPLCDKLDVTRIFLSALVCAFCLVACVAEVQTALRS